MDVPVIESAVEEAFQTYAGPMLEFMDEGTKKDTRTHVLLKACCSILELAINDKSSWTLLLTFQLFHSHMRHRASIQVS